MRPHPAIEMSTDGLYHFFLKEAYKVALLSDDPKTKVGAVIFYKDSDVYRMAQRGANILLDTVERYCIELAPLLKDSTWKKDHMQHAEHVAIEQTLRYGHDTEGYLMAMPWAPCMPCAKRIRLARIEALVMHKQLVEMTPPTWQANIQAALDYLAKEGVRLIQYDGTIGGVHHQFNEQLHYP